MPGSVIPFLEFPPEVRKIIYTTNSIESLNYQLRKIIKNRGHFPNDDAVIKLLWLAIRDIEDKRARERGRKPADRKASPGKRRRDWSRAAPYRAGTPPMARSAWPSPAGSGDLVTRRRPRTAGFLHPGQPRRREPRSTQRPCPTYRPGLTAASTGTSFKAEEPGPQHKINTVYTENLTTSGCRLHGLDPGGPRAEPAALFSNTATVHRWVSDS